jgi:hypothetical protein
MPTQLLQHGRTSFGAVCVALVVLGVGGLGLSLPGQRPRDFLVRRLEASIATLPETEVLPQVRRLAALGDDGTAAVVRLLGSGRECEAQAAEIALTEQLDHWPRLPVEQAAPRVIHLARQLAALESQISARRPRFLRDLTTQLSLWPTCDAGQANELLAVCEKILATSVERNSFRSSQLDAESRRTE